MNPKRFLLISGIFVLIILGIFEGIKYFTSSSQEQVVQNQTTPTPIRHDNSGAGSTDENSPIQDHMQRALQHLGL